ncbi:hypothetical protein KCU95_g11112, partial [Aureobasidium melanogenum]
MASEDKMREMMISLMEYGYTLDEIERLTRPSRTASAPPSGPALATTSRPPTASSLAEEQSDVKFVQRMVIDSYPRSGEETPSSSAHNSGRSLKRPGKSISAESGWIGAPLHGVFGVGEKGPSNSKNSMDNPWSFGAPISMEFLDIHEYSMWSYWSSKGFPRLSYVFAY